MGACRCGKETKNPKYCSKACMYKYRVRPTGLKYTITTPNKGWFKPGVYLGRGFKKGQVPANFKGDSVGYDALHDWVIRHAGHAKLCEQCSNTVNVHWANVSGDYQRDLSDFIALCVPCHRRFDKRPDRKRAKEIFEVRSNGTLGTRK